MIAHIAKTLWCLAMLALTTSLFTDSGNIRRADHRGYQLYSSGEYDAASTTFSSSYWQAIALYRDGQFEDAASIFAGYDTAESHFNQGNALLFQGKYADAAARYTRALELKPNWGGRNHQSHHCTRPREAPRNRRRRGHRRHARRGRHHHLQ